MVTLREIAQHSREPDKSDREDLLLLQRRKKKYQERMSKFSEENKDIFSISKSKYFNSSIWEDHFNNESETDFELYDAWNKTTRGM